MWISDFRIILRKVVRVYSFDILLVLPYAVLSIKQEDDFFAILDLNPLNEDDKKKLDDRALIELITHHPNLFKKLYKFGCHGKKICPIVMAYFLDASPDAIDLMSEAFPRGKELCPLTALLMSAPNNVFEKSLQTTSTDIEETFCDLCYIQIACKFSVGFELIEYLVDRLHPKFLTKLDSGGCTPLFLACKNESKLEVIKLLAEKSPRSLKVRNKRDVTVLQIACAKKSASISIVNFLIDEWPDALRMCDSDGNYPLHDACSFNAKLTIIKVLVDKYTGVLSIKNRQCHIPFSIAKKNTETDPAIICFLGVTSFYKKLTEKDERADVPKINELVPFVCDSHILRIFYSITCTSFRSGYINFREANILATAGLTEASKTTCNLSRRTFKAIMAEAFEHNIIPAMEMLALDKEAELYHAIRPTFSDDIWFHINCNTTSSLRKSGDLNNIHLAMRELMVNTRNEEKGSGFVFINFVLAVGSIDDEVGREVKGLLNELMDFGCLIKLEESVKEIGDAGLTDALQSGRCAGEEFLASNSGVNDDALGELTQMFRYPAYFGRGVVFALAFCAKITGKISFEEGRSSSNSSRTSAMPPQSPAVDGGPSQSLRYSQSIYSQGSRPGVRPTPRESERPTHRESIIGDLPRMPGARPINRETAVGDLPRTTGTGHRRSNSGESILSGISNASNRPTMAQRLELLEIEVGLETSVASFIERLNRIEINLHGETQGVGNILPRITNLENSIFE